MATVTDTLVTVMTLQGAESVISGITNLSTNLLRAAASTEAMKEAQETLNVAQAALLAPLTTMIAEVTTLSADLISATLTFGAMAEAEGVAAAATAVLDAALALLEAPLVLIIGLLAALTLGAIAAAKALSAFGDEEKSVSRVRLQLQALKGSIPFPDLKAFSDHLEHLTGISHNTIQSLGATAAQFGLTKSQIEKLLPVTLDIAQAKGLDPEQVLTKLLRASRGRPQGLVALGIDPSKIQGDLKNVDNLINQVGKGFAGTAEGFRNTLPGTTAALGTAMENLFKALGRFIGPVVVPVLNLLISGIEKATALLNRLADFLHIAAPGDAALAGGKSNPLALKGDPEQTELMAQTANNTQKMSDAFHKGVLGGPGTIANRAFSARDAKIAFGI